MQAYPSREGERGFPKGHLPSNENNQNRGKPRAYGLTRLTISPRPRAYTHVLWYPSKCFQQSSTQCHFRKPDLPPIQQHIRSRPPYPASLFPQLPLTHLPTEGRELQWLSHPAKCPTTKYNGHTKGRPRRANGFYMQAGARMSLSTDVHRHTSHFQREYTSLNAPFNEARARHTTKRLPKGGGSLPRKGSRVKRFKRKGNGCPQAQATPTRGTPRDQQRCQCERAKGPSKLQEHEASVQGQNQRHRRHR